MFAAANLKLKLPNILKFHELHLCYYVSLVILYQRNEDKICIGYLFVNQIYEIDT